MVLNSCSKEKLPEATQTGANTFGCKINGKTWIPNGTHDLFVSIPALYSSFFQHNGIRWLNISARKDPSLINNEDDSYDDLSLTVALPVSTNDTIINKNCYACNLYCPYSSMRLQIQGLFNGACYATDSLHPGLIHFSKIDTLNRIFSGDFEFSAFDKNTGNTISVTEGRFDVIAR